MKPDEAQESPVGLETTISTTALVPADRVLRSHCLLVVIRHILRSRAPLCFYSLQRKTTPQIKQLFTVHEGGHETFYTSWGKKPGKHEHEEHFDPQRTRVHIRPRSPNHLREYLVYSAMAPHNIHRGFTVFLSLLIEACQTFPALCERTLGCVCVCMLWPEHRHEHNMWIHLLKIPNTCSYHEPKQGDGFLFCSWPFWKERLPPFHRSPTT